jgi:predicted Rossmann fold nucleotide-binding protein DprA/Smf involved in DNA uptake
MAKRGPQTNRSTERKIVRSAEELGRIVGAMRGRADNWTGERQRLIKRLSTVVGEAQSLLSDLGHRAQREAKRLASARAGAVARDAGARTPRKSRRNPTARKTKIESR